MKTTTNIAILLGLTVISAALVRAEEFTIKSAKSKQVFGPFDLKDGAVIVLDGVSYKLYSENVAEPQRQMHNNPNRMANQKPYRCHTLRMLCPS
jgi:hypothetical protein